MAVNKQSNDVLDCMMLGVAEDRTRRGEDSIGRQEDFWFGAARF